MAKVKPVDGTPTRLWATTHGTYIAGRAWIDEADVVALEMERKWGIGRLRLLVGPELREKFDRQRLMFNQAVWHGQDLEQVRRESQRMATAWRALDRAVTEVGKRPVPAEFVECPLPDGSVAVIVPDNAPVEVMQFDGRYNAPGEAVQVDGRSVSVWTASEIGRVLAAFPAVSRAKAAFPGATVTAVRPIADPLDSFADSRDGLDAPMVEDREIGL